MASTDALKEVPVTGISTHTIVDLTMMDGDDEIETVKVPIMDESNSEQGRSLSVKPQPKGTPLDTNVVEKVPTLRVEVPQLLKEEKAQESDVGEENEEQSLDDTTLRKEKTKTKGELEQQQENITGESGQTGEQTTTPMKKEMISDPSTTSLTEDGTQQAMPTENKLDDTSSPE